MIVSEDKKTRLIMQAALLTQEERFCISGYLYTMRYTNIAEMEARQLAYKLSRTKKPLKTEKEPSIRKLSERWFNSDKVKAYIRLQEIAIEEGVQVEQDNYQTETQNEAKVINLDEDEETQANKRYNELEEMKASASPDFKLKLIAAQDSIAHRNKDNFKEESKQVLYYLPLRCHDCALYKEAEKQP